MSVRVQEAEFDPGAEVSSFCRGRTDIGAVVAFTGIVRDVTDSLNSMRIEHYPGMTEAALKKIESEAVERWNLGDSLIIHRFGDMKPGDLIMMVATAAPHRGDAFAAAEFLMDYLKSRAPFWKKEITPSGETWVDAKDEDEAALSRWSS